MVAEPTELESEFLSLRAEVNYWRSLHARAVEREAALKQRVLELEKIVRRQEALIQEQAQQIEALKAKVAWLQQQVFGRKSEQMQEVVLEANEVEEQPSELTDAPSDSSRKRGQQPGAPGHGRRCHPELPTEEIFHDLPQDKSHCPNCGKPYDSFPDTEDSEEIHWDVRVVRRVHKRARYIPTCDCRVVPGIVTAPVPPKLIPKGLFSIEFWCQIILEKFLLQRPLYRVRMALELHGLYISQGTLTEGLERIGELLQPVYTRILERSRAARHWHWDETRWMVFVDVEGKDSHMWWLWVAVTVDTVAYLLEPSRSSEVPRNHLGEEAQGIISADRYSAYKALGEKIVVAFCWVHVRRDFIRVRDGYRKLRSWGEGWVARINEVFEQNDKRLAVLDNPEAFAIEDQALRQLLAEMAQTREEELADPNLHPAQRKALESQRNHWEGLMIFVDHPEIPMDNNESERRLRNPVVGRKNYYGSGSIWSGVLAAASFTIHQTLLLNHIDPLKWHVAYFNACAQNGGRPTKDIDSFLPWNLPQDHKAAWYYPKSRPP